MIWLELAFKTFKNYLQNFKKNSVDYTPSYFKMGDVYEWHVH